MDQQQQHPSFSTVTTSFSVSDPEIHLKKGRRVTLSAISNISNILPTPRCTRNTSVESDRLQSQWEILMRNFSEDRKRQDHSCKNNIRDDLKCEWRKKKTFATGSTYDGTWDGLGLCGYGRYTFPNGVVYEGEFEDSNFDGEGELRYPDGIILKGRWHDGELIDKTIIFSDGVDYKEGGYWNYCKSPDRRYSREFKSLVGAGKPNLTNEQPTKNISDGTYDTGDGVYDPMFNTVHDYDNPDKFIRMPDPPAVKWLMENCRSKPDRTIGACPQLYKEWVKPSLVFPQVPPTPFCVTDSSDSDKEDVEETYFNETSQRDKFYKDGANDSLKTASSQIKMPGREQSVDLPGLKITLGGYYQSLKKSSTLQALKTPITKSSRSTGIARWQAMMKKFSQSHVETCKKLPEELETSERDKKNFPTGSSYEGSWNALGMSGHGVYKYPNSGVIYVGEFDDGMFHGNGELRYESGAILKGKWHKGRLTDKTLIFDDGLEYAEQDWMYNRYPDRRYTVEINDGVAPAGRSHITAESPSPDIHPGFYDVGDGLYDPITKLVYRYGDEKILRTVSNREHQWVLSNCRTKPDHSVGPCPFFYEEWQKPALKAQVEPTPPTPSYKGLGVSISERRISEINSGMLSCVGISDVVSGILYRDKGGKFDLRSSSAPMQKSALLHQASKDNDKFSANVLSESTKSHNVVFNHSVGKTNRNFLPFSSSIIFTPSAESSTNKGTINW